VIEPTPISEPLDGFLVEVVQVLRRAVDRGIQSLDKDPSAADQTIKDCKEILGTIMAGHVEEWLAS
jgi:hypothetical protein